ncbi:conserved domain protein [Paenibacillus sp. HGF5]|nr:conserved domain protein [Paenibacillus sp. HGF5]
MLILDTVMHSRQVHNPLRYGYTSNLARIKQLGIAWSQIKKADWTKVIQVRLKFFFVFEFFTKSPCSGNENLCGT